MAQPIAKVRSRRDGSAIPLDELDKRLLNLLQGSFPIAERPVTRTWPAWRACPRTRF